MLKISVDSRDPDNDIEEMKLSIEEQLDLQAEANEEKWREEKTEWHKRHKW